MVSLINSLIYHVKYDWASKKAVRKANRIESLENK